MMNNMTVGMENLPNVFIDKVIISQNKLKIKLSMYDEYPHTWKGKINDLKIKISYETDLNSISSLDQGTTSLYDYDSFSTPSPNLNVKSQTHVISAITLDILPEVAPYADRGQFSKYFKFVEFSIPEGYQNLNVYAACFIDNLEFGNPMFNKFYGPMTGERILVGGEINKTSNYFYYPDSNEEYGGPVHQNSNGDFMEGSFHTDQDHKIVIPVYGEANFKIIGEY